MTTVAGQEFVDTGLNADPPGPPAITVPGSANFVNLLWMGYTGGAINADVMTTSAGAVSSPIVTENGSGLSSNNSVHSTAALGGTGAQTATLSWNGSGAGFLTELGALAAFYLVADDPADCFRAEDSDVSQYGTGSATCTTTVASAADDVVLGVTTAFGGIPATPSGCTSLATAASIGGNGMRIWQVNSPGASSTSITSGTESFPSQYMASFKSGAAAAVKRLLTLGVG